MSDEKYSGWLTAEEVAEALGVSHVSQVTRAAQSGRLRREKVNHRWMYDPSSVAEAVTGIPGSEPQEAATQQTQPPQQTAPVQLPPTTTPAAESVLAGGAAMVRANASLVTQLVDAVLKSQAQQTAMLDALSRTMIGIVERQDARCTKLESLQVDFITAREAFLSSAAEREVKSLEVAGNLALKEKAVGQLIENIGPLLELAKMYIESKEESSHEPPGSKEVGRLTSGNDSESIDSD